MDLFQYPYLNQNISFELKNGNVMVNATEMARLFDKKVENFTRIANTKAFINAAIKNADKRFISIKKEEDLIVSRQKSGTWMHRILALKFAAWLDPEFELWVFCMVDDVLYKHFSALEENLKKAAVRKTKIQEIENKLLKNEDYIKLLELKGEDKKSAYQRGKLNRSQLNLFHESYSTQHKN